MSVCLSASRSICRLKAEGQNIMKFFSGENLEFDKILVNFASERCWIWPSTFIGKKLLSAWIGDFIRQSNLPDTIISESSTFSFLQG